MPIRPHGWVYAVRRDCVSTHSCDDICNSKYLHVQDPQTVSKSWRCVGALHVYDIRPATGNGKPPKLGLKTLYHGYENCKHSGSCGPNYCCCRAIS